MRTHFTTFIIILTLAFAAFPAAAEVSSITLGGSAGWPDLSVSDGLARGKGRLGKEALVLSTESQPSRAAPAANPPADRAGNPTPAGRPSRAAVDSNPAPRDDLYLSFDGKDFRDAAGNYDIRSNALLFVGGNKPRRGSGAALANTDGLGLVLRGKPGSLFSTPGDAGSFSIEFWLYPAVTENGSNLFEWRSSRNGAGSSIYQYIRAAMFRNRLEWTFSNIWQSASGVGQEISLSGRKNLVPGSWSHHELSYDAESGRLEYRLDGSVEDVSFITSDGGESGDVYPAVFGVPADVSVASRFSGLVDEFRVRRVSAPEDSLENRHAALDRYAADGGRFESMPLDSGGLESSLNALTVVESIPEGTGTAYFVRAGDNFYEWTADWPAWQPVEPGKKISGVTGKYFQVAGELYPDGAGSSTPSVTSVTLGYEKDTPPWPPSKVFAKAGDGCVTLEWIPSVDFDAAGYLVYYGERPGEYLGAGSPVDAGSDRSCIISGLRNGKAYYFCVAAYDSSGPRYPGVLSGEVWARPLAARREAGGTEASRPSVGN